MITVSALLAACGRNVTQSVEIHVPPGTSDTVRTVTKYPASIQVNPDSTQVFLGGTYRFSGTATDSLNRSTTIIWSSLDPSVATVDNSGLVTSVGVGLARINAVNNSDPSSKKTVKIAVVVIPVPKFTPTIRISPDSTAITIPATFTFAGVATDSLNRPTTIIWSSLDQSIASIDRNTGVVTGIATGVARIVGSNASDTSKKATSKVSVTQQVQSITISPASIVGKIGGSFDFVVTVVPANYTFRCISSGAAVVGMLLTSNTAGQKICRATFFGLSPQAGVSPVQVYAETDSIGTLVGGARDRLRAGAEVRVTATGLLVLPILGFALELGDMVASDATAVKRK